MIRILDTLSGTATGDAYKTEWGGRLAPRLCQVEMTSTGTVTVQGRMESDMSWIDVATFTTTSAQFCQVFYQMRATCTANAGQVKVTLDAELEVGSNG